MSVRFDGFLTFLLILVRMSGMFAFNPLLSIRSVPSRVTMGLALLFTILLLPTATAAPQMAPSDAALAISRELFIGFAMGFVFQAFYYFLFFVGDFMDMQFGLSMSKVFNPATSVSTSISGSFLTIAFVLYFFASDSHLILIKLFAHSFSVLPVGHPIEYFSIAKLAIELFAQTFLLAIRLLLPFAAAELVVEVSMGILMRLIPQIHVFVINIQFKILSGFVLMILFAAPVANFLDNYILLMFENMQRMLMALAA